MMLVCIMQKLEYLWHKERYLKKVNSILLLAQTSCLGFKMAIYRKDVNFVIVALWSCSQQIKHELKSNNSHSVLKKDIFLSTFAGD